VNTLKSLPNKYDWHSEEQKQGMKLTTIIAIFVAGVLLLAGGIAIGRLSVDIQSRPVGSAVVPSVEAVPTADLSVPELDVPGDDIPGLPRFPGMRRVEYRQVIMGDLLETEAEYVMEGPLSPVHDYYRQIFDDEGWSVADLQIFQGEWTFFVIQNGREALVELESRGPLVEVEIELNEPLPNESAAVTPTP
jgi:hypothetical protein